MTTPCIDCAGGPGGACRTKPCACSCHHCRWTQHPLVEKKPASAAPLPGDLGAAAVWNVRTCRRCDTLHVRGGDADADCRTENYATEEDVALLNAAPALRDQVVALRAELAAVREQHPQPPRSP